MDKKTHEKAARCRGTSAGGQHIGSLPWEFPEGLQMSILQQLAGWATKSRPKAPTLQDQGFLLQAHPSQSRTEFFILCSKVYMMSITPHSEIRGSPGEGFLDGRRLRSEAGGHPLGWLWGALPQSAIKSPWRALKENAAPPGDPHSSGLAPACSWMCEFLHTTISNRGVRMLLGDRDTGKR